MPSGRSDCGLLICIGGNCTLEKDMLSGRSIAGSGRSVPRIGRSTLSSGSRGGR